MSRAFLKTKNPLSIIFCGLIVLAVIGTSSCTSSNSSGGFTLLGPPDETEDAGKIIAQANEDLTKIKKLYNDNESKREELKAAMETNNTEQTRKIADEVVRLIDTGSGYGIDAVNKIQKAQELQINQDYRDYLQLKESAIKRQLEAFDNYFQAAKLLRDKFDPKNKVNYARVKEEFKTRGEDYRKKMDEARSLSIEANELAKRAKQKEVQGP